MRVEDIIKKAKAMDPEGIGQAGLVAAESMDALVTDIRGMADEVLDDLHKGRLDLMRDDLTITIIMVEAALETFPRLKMLREATGKGE
jgi:hypothetical protein